MLPDTNMYAPMCMMGSCPYMMMGQCPAQAGAMQGMYPAAVEPKDLPDDLDDVDREEDDNMYRRPPFGPGPFFGPRPFPPGPFYGPRPFFPGPFFGPRPFFPPPVFYPRPGFGFPFLTGLALGGLLF